MLYPLTTALHKRHFSSLTVALLIMTSSTISLFMPRVYKAETLNWKIQSIGQDLVNLVLIVPLLIACVTFDSIHSVRVPRILAGCHLYLVYTFTIYSFDIHFNFLFLIYVAVLGLSFYSALYFIHIIIKENEATATPGIMVTRYCGIYFIVLSLLFFALWMSQIMPSVILNTAPEGLQTTGLFTNPVHVLDLAIVLPAFCLAGIFLLKRTSLGISLAPVLLTFSMLMDLTIAGLAVVLKYYNQAEDTPIVFVMVGLALISLIFFFLFSRKKSKAS